MRSSSLLDIAEYRGSAAAYHRRWQRVRRRELEPATVKVGGHLGTLKDDDVVGGISNSVNPFPPPENADVSVPRV